MPNAPPSVLILVPTSERGGNEEYALSVGATFVERGFAVRAGFPDCPGTATLREDFRRSGVECLDLDISEADPRSHGSRADARRALRTLRALVRSRPTVVYLVLPWPVFGFGSIVACAALKIPTAVVFQLAPKHFAIPRWKAVTYAWARSRHQRWVAVSQDNRRFLCSSFGVSPAEVRVIYNGTRPSAFADASREERDRLRREVRHELGLPSDAPLLVTVGRLHPQKGYADLIEIIPDMLSSRPAARFVWVGDGPQRDELRGQLRARAVEGAVHMVGYRKDARRILAAADLFVFPTRFEGGQSFALTEAMAERIPIVSSSASGIPEILENGVHGVLFRPGDSAGLLEAIRWAMQNLDDMRRMAGAALERVDQFSEQRMLAQILQLLEELRVVRGDHVR